MCCHEDNKVHLSKVCCHKDDKVLLDDENERMIQKCVVL